MDSPADSAELLARDWLSWPDCPTRNPASEAVQSELGCKQTAWNWQIDQRLERGLSRRDGLASLRNGALGHSSLESIGENKTQPHLRCAVRSPNRPETSKTPNRFLDRFFSLPPNTPQWLRPTRSGGVLQCRAIVPNGSATTRSGGVLRLFGCFVLLFVVVSGSDRLGTIDLPCRRAAAVSYSVELSFTEADYFPMQKRLNKASSTSLLATVPATWPNSSSANRNSPATNSSPARSTHVCLA